MYNKSFQLALQQMNIFLYQKALNNSFAFLNCINTDPCNENAAYWLMNVVCWLAYKMVYLEKLSLNLTTCFISTSAMKKISNIVCETKILNYKKKKIISKIYLLYSLYWWVFSTFFLFVWSDLTGISKIPDLGQTWTLSTDALKQGREKKINWGFVWRK